MPSLKPNGKRLNGKGGGWITPARRLGIYLRDGFTCAYCGRDCRELHPSQMTLEHLVPRCKGGSHASENLVLACTWCNSARQEVPLDEFATPVQLAEIATRISTPLNMTSAKELVANRKKSA